MASKKVAIITIEVDIDPILKRYDKLQDFVDHLDYSMKRSFPMYRPKIKKVVEPKRSTNT